MADLKLSIDDMFLMLSNTTCVLGYQKQNQVIQNMAYKLEEWFNVTRDELRSALEKVGFKLDECCSMCNAEMPTFDGIGDPICSECDSDDDSVS